MGGWVDPRVGLGAVEKFSSVGSQNSSHGVSSRKKRTMCQIVIYELLYKGSINWISKSKTHLISHANLGYVTILKSEYFRVSG
jgi:hypothetical protein